jgi:hypothetical protein
MMRLLMNYEGYRRKWSWPNLRDYISIALEILRASWVQIQELKPGPPKNKSGMLVV